MSLNPAGVMVPVWKTGLHPSHPGAHDQKVPGVKVLYRYERRPADSRQL